MGIDQNFGIQNSGTASNYSHSNRRTNCYVCKAELHEEEIDFYPCNCQYNICFQCYNRQVEERDKKCPNCLKLYDVQRIAEYLRKSNRHVKQLSSNQETHSSSNMSSYSLKQGSQNQQSQASQIQKSPSQNKRTSSENFRATSAQQKLTSVRILQKHILYVIGISPSIAREDILRKYEYFGQYGRINQVTINKDKAYKSENQGTCYSVYISYSIPEEASLAILAVDQFVFDNRLIRASFGRTKYCKFFLKQAQCLNKECPYQHSFCNGNEVLTQDDMQKKQLFLQCAQIAIEITRITQVPDSEFKAKIKLQREALYPNQHTKTMMPPAENIFQKKSLFTQFNNFQLKSQSLTQLNNTLHSSRRVTNKDPSASSTINLQPFLKEPSLTLTQTQSAAPRLSVLSQPLLTQSTPKEIYVRKDQLLKQGMKQEDQKKAIDNCATVEQQPLTIQQEDFNAKVKRNISSDERNKQNKNQTKERVHNFEQQLANSLKKHLGPQQNQDLSRTNHEGMSTNQSISIFNEKKNSRFLSLKDEDDQNDQDDQSLMLSRRSSVAQTLNQKKGSNQSLIIENVLKFLNDDTDVVPAKREPLIAYRYNPPSEYQNVATSTYSHLGGNEEDQWNNTIFSQQEYRVYQQTYCMPDDKSYYSQGFIPQMRINNTAGDMRNSFVANSFQNFNTNWQQKSQLNDSGKMNTYSNNFIKGSSFVGQSNYYPLQNQTPAANYRKTTFAHNDSNFEAGVQFTRSPSQPKIDNNGFTNSSQQQLNITRQQFSNTYQSQKGLQGFVDPSLTKQMPFQANMSVKDLQMNRLHSISFDKQMTPLNQQKFELFDRNDTSKDIHLANIFRQDGVASNNNMICSQSLFCYKFDDDYYDDNGWQRNKGKFLDMRNIPRTPVKYKKTLLGFTNDDDNFSQFDEDNTTTKNSEPKNYYKEYLSVKDSFGANNIFVGKRRNSLDEDREKLQPQYLQFHSPFKTANYQEEEEGKTQPTEKRSKSRSQQRQMNQSNKDVLGISSQRD